MVNDQNLDNTWLGEDLFPPSDMYICPPADAHSFNGTIYRFMTESKPCLQDLDLLSEKEGFRKRTESHPSELCQGAGLSAFIDLDAAKKALIKLTQNSVGLKKKFGRFNCISSISITDDDGRIKNTSSQTSPDHYTWWCFKSIDYLKRAEIIQPVLDNGTNKA